MVPANTGEVAPAVENVNNRVGANRVNLPQNAPRVENRDRNIDRNKNRNRNIFIYKIKRHEKDN